MSLDYEVVFEGKILIGSEEQRVKQNVGRMFKADDAKLAALFSGRTVVIKSGVDKATAQKYVQAMKKAGAQAEIRSLAKEEPVVQAQNPASFGVKDFDRPSLTSVAESHSVAQAEKAAKREEKAKQAEEPIGIPVPEVEEASEAEVQKAMNALESQHLPDSSNKQSETEVSASVGNSNTDSDRLGIKNEDLTIAPAGAMILPDSKKEAPEAPSTDHLQVKPMEGYLVEPEPEQAVKVPDVSHIKLKE